MLLPLPALVGLGLLALVGALQLVVAVLIGVGRLSDRIATRRFRAEVAAIDAKRAAEREKAKRDALDYFAPSADYYAPRPAVPAPAPGFSGF